MRRNFFCCISLFSLLLAMNMAGCVQSSPSGKWVKNHHDAKVFEGKTLLKEHTYYYRGNEVTPESIIAIDNRYTLKTKVWSKVNITQEILDDWMYWINTQANVSCPHYGGTILTPDEQKAGIWYSKKMITTVKTPEPGVLVVYPPYSLPGSACARQERFDDI